MKCKICYVQEGDKRCKDCGIPVCEDCRADFPHHAKPHVRCENCYLYGRGGKPVRRDRDSEGEEWKG